MNVRHLDQIGGKVLALEGVVERVDDGTELLEGNSLGDGAESFLEL